MPCTLVIGTPNTVHAPLLQPENRQEFLIIYFDDQQDLQTWGVAGKLQEAALATFPRPSIFTQEDLANHKFVWPTPGQMVASGHRFVFVSGADYGAATAPTIFPKGDSVCGWREPPLRTIEGVPQCSVNGGVGDQPDVLRRRAHTGRELRADVRPPEL